MRSLRLSLSLASFALAVALPSSLGAVITQFGFLAGMNGANEVPANVSAGSVTITTLEYDSAVGANGTFTVNLSFSGLSGNATAAHIHGFIAAGANAGVLQGLTATTGATSGTITGTWALPDGTAVTNLFADLTYINLHSAFYPGGELRGQLTPIPEPSTWAAILGALSLGGVLWRRHRR